MVHLVLAFSFRWLSSWSWIMLFSSENSILLGWLWSLDWSHKQKHSQHFGNEHYDMFYSSSPPLAWYCTSLAPSMFLSHGRKRAWYIILFFRSHIKKDLFLLMAQDKSVSSIHFPPLPPPKKKQCLITGYLYSASDYENLTPTCKSNYNFFSRS